MAGTAEQLLREACTFGHVDSIDKLIGAHRGQLEAIGKAG
jgi:hypothetical protein